jgi:hypothetical protein
LFNVTFVIYSEEMEVKTKSEHLLALKGNILRSPSKNYIALHSFF